MSNERINFTDTTMDIVLKMSEGNPGAATVMMQLLTANTIDPDSAFGVFGPVFNLDSFGIYGTDIYILYNDICNSNLSRMVAVLRAVQLGLFDRNILKNAAHRQDRSGKELVPVEELYVKVKKELPNFDTN